jgi:hypothetical protein
MLTRKAKPKAKKNPTNREPREDTNQIAYRVVQQEVIKRSESLELTPDLR